MITTLCGCVGDAVITIKGTTCSIVHWYGILEEPPLTTCVSIWGAIHPSALGYPFLVTFGAVNCVTVTAIPNGFMVTMA